MGLLDGTVLRAVGTADEEKDQRQQRDGGQRGPEAAEQGEGGGDHGASPKIATE